MNNNDLIIFTKMLIDLGEVYSKTISVTLTNFYWQSLKHLGLPALKRAIEAHIKNPDHGQYFPKPADFIRLIEGSKEHRALKAWSKVRKAINQIGAYNTVVFDDALIHAVLQEMGGWINLCTTSIKEISFRANEFQKHYMIFLEQPPNSYPKYCCGIIENINNKKGYTTKNQIFIGDLEKAKQVMFTGSNILFTTVHY